MKNFTLSSFLLLPLLLIAYACNNQPNQYYASIQTAGLIEFRCIENEAGQISGSVLDGCGCNEIITQEDGSKIIRKWGSIACACVDYVPQDDGTKQIKTIELVEADISSCQAVFDDQNCIQAWKCLPKLNAIQSDWIRFEFENHPKPISSEQLTEAQKAVLEQQPTTCPQAPLPLVPMSCESKQSTSNRKTVGYIGNPSDGQVALLELTGSDKGIVDLDKTIPGTSNMTVKGFMDQMQMHPYGEYLLVLKGLEGSISIISQHQLLPDMVLNLGLGSIDDILVYPPIDRSYQNNERLPPPKLYLSQADQGKIIEIDLDALSQYISQIKLGENVSLKTSELISREWDVFGTNGKKAKPYLLSITPEIHFQYHTQYAYDDDPLNTIHHQFLFTSLQDDNDLIGIDLLSPTPQYQYIRLDHVGKCQDSYLVGVLPPSQASLTCEDGLDNDNDGLTDQADEDCLHRFQESKIPYCPKLSNCLDQIDNDGNGQIDAQDIKCNFYHDFMEEEPKECNDNQDNDHDGLYDRDDPGCSSELDDHESLNQEAPSCLDGLDNDLDGKIDLEDSQCDFITQYQENKQLSLLSQQQRWILLKETATVDACEDGLDNDQDGHADLDDIDCQLFDSKEILKNRKNPAAIYGEPAQCHDQIDNDQDGAVDMADRDCFFAQDHTEADEDILLSPLQVHTFLYRAPVDYFQFDEQGNLSTQQENIIYPMIFTLSADGNLMVSQLDLINNRQQSQRLSFTLGVQSFTLRQQDQLSSILAVTEDFNLRNMPIQQHKPLLTPRFKLKIYASIKSKSDRTYQIDQFYFVKEGKAYPIPALNPWIGAYDRTQGLDQNIVVLPTAVNELLLNINDVEVSIANAIPFDRLPQSDVQVFSTELYFPYQEWNTILNPVDQQNQLSSSPVLLKDGFKLSYDPNRHPQFCRDFQENCVILGYDENQVLESDEQREARRKNELDLYEGIEIKEKNPKRILPGNYLLSYEGVIPKSKSSFGHWTSKTENTWTLTDPSVDYCELGVEVGDLWEAQAFYPLNQESLKKPECAPFLNIAIDAGIYPLRYRVKEVHANTLVLEIDSSSRYDNQMPPNEFNSVPLLAPAPQIPPYYCAAQNISYQIRPGKDQWLLTHETVGYLHAWVNSGGQCVKAPSLVAQQRQGRVKLGERFENQWFKFQLNTLKRQDNTNLQSIGVPNDKDPFMLGLSFQWTVNVGLKYAQTPTNITHIKSIKWLANLDRLYLSDALYQNITELVKLSPYNETPSYLQAFK